MARSTPTNTPIRNYAIAFFISAFLLFSDIGYETFAPIRGFLNASTLYVQTISRGIVENINTTLSSFYKNKNLLQENKELTEQILQTEIKYFFKSKNNEEQIQIINLQNNPILQNGNGINIFKIASIDLRNYLCCSTHKIFLHNPNQVKTKQNSSVFAGGSFVGQTKKTYMNFIEVILLSDIKHVLPVKTNFFYCDARGKGVPMLVSCMLDKPYDAFENNIGDIVYTSGLGGIFFKNTEIGFISAVVPVSIKQIEVVITLKTNPLEENFYGVISNLTDEI